MKPVVEVKHLCKHYDQHAAVNDLSFTVQEEDIYGFLGQNGAGKSTTIRMMLTLIAPTSGSINIFGLDLKQHRNEILSRTGAIIERPDLYKYLTAYDNLSIFARLSGMKINRSMLMDQLEMVGLANRAKDKVKTFSQGMKQRLGIAISLIHNPRLLILDEPTNGLDPQGIADMRNLILRLKHDFKKTIIISSHLLSEVELIANRMIIIDQGKKIVEGEVATLLDPNKTLVEITVSKHQDAIDKLLASQWAKYFISNTSLQLTMSKALIPDFIKECVERDISLFSVKTSHSLENYFLSLTTPNQHVESFAN